MAINQSVNILEFFKMNLLELSYKYEDKLIKLQRQLCKMVRHSNNYKKQTKRIAKIHEKIANIRNDFSNKLSWQIINDNQVIISEDLQVSNMIKNHIPLHDR
ncbi:MAG: transposase [Clostridium sp.]|uniref:transposase n=1 Tax=Clostridium sp. TaxID=1506 RepID=UPI003D6CA8AC